MAEADRVLIPGTVLRSSIRVRKGTSPLAPFLFFFFQAEDSIRAYKVTGVQTCALPISAATRVGAHIRRAAEARDPALCCRRAVTLRVDLQRAADEEVAGILSRDLC